VYLSGPWLARPASCVSQRYRTPKSLCEICGRQSGTDTGFCPKNFSFPWLCLPANAPYSSTTPLVSEGGDGKICKPVGNQGALDIQVLANCFVFKSLYGIRSYGQPTRGCSLRWSLGGEFTIYECKDERAKKGHTRPQT
jgi:hypothetical protein